MKPQPSTASEIDIKSEYSLVNIPVNIKLKNIENLINTYIEKLIYYDDNIEDDDLKIKLWKQDTVRLKHSDGRIEIALPLKAEVDYRFGTNKLGFDMYTTRSFDFNGTITFLSTVDLDQWHLKTQTNLKSIDWHEKPTMLILGKKISINRVVNSAVKYFKEQIEHKVDTAISESLSYKPYVIDALKRMSQPIQLNSDYNSWLRVVPNELYVTNATINNDTIKFLMGMKCEIETHVGQKPLQKLDTLIPLKTVKDLPNQVTAHLIGMSTYKNASEVLTKNFIGYEMGTGRKKVMIKHVDLWQKNNQLIVALDVVGNISGTLYLSGNPMYDEINKEIYFENLDYVIDTKNVLAKTASFIANKYILNEIKTRCRYSISDLLSSTDLYVKEFLDHYEPVKGVYVNGKIDSVKFQELQLTNDAMIIIVKAMGEVSIEISGL